jgi:hypothetical protein
LSGRGSSLKQVLYNKKRGPQYCFSTKNPYTLYRALKKLVLRRNDKKLTGDGNLE